MESYHIFTINGNELMEVLSQQWDKAKKNNQKLEKLTVNLRRNPQVIQSVSKFDDSALFYQLAKTERNNSSAWTEDSLLHKIVFIDFKGVFGNSMQRDKQKSKLQKEKDEQKEKILQRLFLDSDGFKADQCSTSVKDGGLFIDFDGDGQAVNFVPFDKSSSMSRRSRTSFIDSHLKEQVDKRLLLDLAFSRIQTSPSKLYAYRGLYLSSGSRITPNDNLKLSAETVIVISDYVQPIKPPIQLFGEEGRTATPKEDLNNKHWMLKTYTEDRQNAIKTLPFDGEGLIALEYAKEINLQLDKRYAFSACDKKELCVSDAEETNKRLGGGSIDDNTIRKAASSFQIRMPFTKGVLHAVDFSRFLQEYVSVPQEQPLYIKDCFGIKRDLRKAKIILTESMFKCKKWMKNLRDKPDGSKDPDAVSVLQKDPMEYFFKKMDVYEHALYVGNTDIILSNSNRTKMNYQFLSTLLTGSGGLSEDDFKAMVNENYKGIVLTAEDWREQWKSKLPDADDDGSTSGDEDTSVDESIESEEEDTSEDESITGEEDMSGDTLIKPSRIPVWFRALAKNDAFFSDPKVKGQISGTNESILQQCAIGRFEVSGECRFLSGDLLLFLLDLVKRIDKNKAAKKLRSPLKTDDLLSPVKDTFKDANRKLEFKGKKEGTEHSLTLFQDRFYMPGARIKLNWKQHYAILRNPHLSRNEQCMLRPYCPAHSDLYVKYFSHLSGVVMLSHFSLDAMALSGADFDGDLVKIIDDQRIVSAIKAGTYQGKETNPSGQKAERKLPIIMIPDTKSAAKEIEDKGTIPYSTIKNTFSNSIGLISNMAVQLQRMENAGIVFQKNGVKDENISTPACTAVTGLEIDAAKTSVHPVSNIREIYEALEDNYGDYFLETKESISKLPKYGITVTKSRDSYVFKSARKEYLKVKVNPEEQNNPLILDYLPVYFAEKKLELKQPSARKASEGNCVHFDFELKNPKWRKELDRAKKEELASLIKAYCGILSFASKLYKTREIYRDAKYRGCVLNLLIIQYDDLDTPLLNEVSVRDAMDITYSCLNDWFSSNQASKEIIAERVTKVLSNMVDSVDAEGMKWQTTPVSRRDARLNELLQYSDSAPDIPAESNALLTNFDSYGYKLLYYMLKDIIAVNHSHISADAMMDTLEDRDQGENNDASANKNSGAISWKELRANPYFNEFYKVYSDASLHKKAKKIWQPEIILKCQEYLRTMFDGDMAIALQYVFDRKSADKNRWFFWDVLPADVILQQVYYAPEKGDQNNAE